MTIYEDEQFEKIFEEITFQLDLLFFDLILLKQSQINGYHVGTSGAICLTYLIGIGSTFS